MSTPSHTATRHGRRIGVIASLIAVAGLLAGCSSGDSSSKAQYAGAAHDPAYANADGADAAAPEAMADPAAERSIIVTGNLYMTVEDPIAVADKAAGVVQKAGGRIDARNETAPDGRSGGSATLTMRIPSSKLDAVVDELRTLGTVDQFSTNSYDVTVEVTDLDAKISTLRASTARIEGLLADAKDISNIITLENELDSRQSQLQSLEAQQRGLNDQVSMSTIDLSLTTEPVVIVEVDNSPKNFWDGLVAGWKALVGFVAVVLIVVGALIPWLLLMALIAAAIVLPIRASGRRNARKRAAAAAAYATQAQQVPMPAAQPAAQPSTPPQPPTAP